MTPTTVRITTPAEVLGTVPALLGFHPEESLVALGLAGKRLAVTARLDLDQVEPDPRAAILAMAAAWTRADVDAVLLVAYAHEFAAMDEACESLAAWAEIVSSSGPRVVDALAVIAGRYRSALCDDAECCPPNGTPVPDSSAASTALAVSGAATVKTRADLYAEVAPSTDAGTERPALADLLDPDPSPVTRDLYLGAAADAGTDTCAARYAEVVAAARALPAGDPQRGHLVTVAAALAYCAGDGARANVCLETVEAERGDDAPSLAGLIDTACRAGMPPAPVRAAFAEAYREIMTA